MQHYSIYDVLVNQDAVDSSAAAHLSEIAAAHPYFTPAQFYLLQQMNSSDQQYSIQAAKTALLFNNTYWLQFQLQQQSISQVKETPVVSMFVPHTEEHKEDEVATAAEELGTIEAITETSINIDEATPNTQPAQPLEPLEPFKPLEPLEPLKPLELLEPLEPLELLEPLDEPSDPEESPMPDITLNLAASIKEAENENALSFEPMHLVDYFASQGIKLSDDIQPSDKLGKQLKSFTEWLKTMKKVHVTELENGIIQNDMTIQNLAEKSNTEGEIVTEAMAEVFAQQGKTGKAIEVYKKLSLLNPLKSAFFAAKIEQLKGE